MGKGIRPILTGVFPRKRLFSLLDRMRRQPVIWVSGPPGCGKTTAVISYLDARNLPCLWYQVDPGDADPATFFYYLGLAAKNAAPRKRKPLPLLTREYLQGIPTFTLRYFENLFARLNPPTADSSPHPVSNPCIIALHRKGRPESHDLRQSRRLGKPGTAQSGLNRGVNRSSPFVEVLSPGRGDRPVARWTFDNMTYHSVGVFKVEGGKMTGTLYAKYMDPSGDFLVVEISQVGMERDWKYRYGTGKWKGVTGGGKAIPFTKGKPISPGTSQGCTKVTGTYQLKK